MLAGVESPAGIAPYQNGQVVWVVAVPVAKARAIQNHRVFKYRLIRFLHLMELIKQIGVLLDMPAVDYLIGSQLVFILLVMRNIVVST